MNLLILGAAALVAPPICTALARGVEGEPLDGLILSGAINLLFLANWLGSELGRL